MKINKVFVFDDRDSLPNIASIKFPSSDENAASMSSKHESGIEEKAISITDNQIMQEEILGRRSFGSHFYSIKCILIVIMVSLVVVTSFLLTTIWISGFSASISKFSQDVLRERIEKVVNFTDETINKVLVVSETTKNILWRDFDYNDTENAYNITYRIYKSSYQFISTLMVTVYFGDTLGGNKGMLVLGGKLTQMLINETGQYYWYCHDFLNSNNCNYKNKDQPDVILGPFDMSKIMAVAHSSPNKPGFSKSFTDPTLPSITFMSCVNSYPSSANSSSNLLPYDWYFGIDISVVSISNYIESVTKGIGGSIAFAIEVDTDYIVVSSFPHIPVSKFCENGTETRMTALTFEQPRVRSIANYLYSSLENNLRSNACGEYRFFSYQDTYVCTYRFCKAGVDWFVVLNVPKWDYIGQMIIALIVGIISSLFIAVVGAVLGIVSSVTMFKPFQHLITIFESISDMKLEDIKMHSSPLLEVNILQRHLQTMLTRLKNYRTMLPPHIIQKLDLENNLRKSSIERLFIERDLSLPSISSINGQMSSVKTKDGPYTPKFERLFSLGLEKRRITSGMIYFDGLDHFLSVLDFDETVSVLNDCFVIIQKTALATNGQIGSFENNYITITWNSIIESSSHEESAIFSVHQILRRLNTTKDKKWKNNHVQNLKFAFRGSIVSQHCVCGNVGTSQIKHYAIFGSYMHNLQLLIKHASKLDIHLIVSEVIFEKNKDSYNFRYVGEKKLLADDESNPPTISPKQDRQSFPTKLYQVGETSSTEEDEKWDWDYHNQASQHFIEGDYDEAIYLFQTHLSNFEEKYSEEDKASLYLLHKCINLNKSCP